MRPRSRLLFFLLLLLGFGALQAGDGAARGAQKPAPKLSEPARWLQGYLRIDTTNPPGNEGKAADYLAAILAREGIASRRLTSPQGRVSLWARLPAAGGRRPALLLLHHMDVVAPGPGWTVPPFAGQVSRGRLWGRGAIDDKSLGIAELAAFVALQRRGVRLARDVIFLAVPDEESGGGQGVGWLVKAHPELFAGVEAVIGEGGRNQVAADGRLLWWGIEVAQKRPLWLEVVAEGRGGHGSGLNPDSANHQLIAALSRLLALPARWHVTPAARTYFAALAPFHGERMRRGMLRLDESIGPEGPRFPLLPGMANLFLDTVQVTVLAGGGRINVIPARAEAKLDVRLLPDTDAQAFLAKVRQALGPDLAVEVLLTAPPAPASPASGRLWSSFGRALGGEAPVVPALVPGFTDSRYFRERGIPAYGLAPFALVGEDQGGVHGVNERLPLAELDRGVERTRRLVADWAAASGSS